MPRGEESNQQVHESHPHQVRDTDSPAEASPCPWICRECRHSGLDETTKPRSRCPSCGSPRLVCHAELNVLTIAHIDCDAFYASIEKRDRPDLVDKPVIIGGGRRGVVSTCCYIARLSGVRSAMPMFKALAACPNAVVIKPDMTKYVEVGRAIRARMFDITPLVEPLSIDEAFLDLSGTERLHRLRPVEVLVRFVQDIERDFGITVSVGLSHNKFLAKIASDLDKPRGFSLVGRKETRSFLAGQSVRAIFGVGKTFAAKLEADGLRSIGDLQRMDMAALAKRYGESGLRLAKLAVGDDQRPVKPDRETKSISTETTFNTDIRGTQALRPILRKLANKVSERAKKAELCGYRITLKLKSANFQTLTRNRTLPDPTNLADKIFRTAEPLLADLADKADYRLIGVGLSELTDSTFADPDDLLDEAAARRAKVERALDALKSKDNTALVETGLTFKPLSKDDV